MFCPKCGAQCADNEYFCYRCGTALHKTQTSKSIKAQKIKRFLKRNKDFLPKNSINELQSYLENQPDFKLDTLNDRQFKHPIGMIIVCLFFGWLGLHRFMINDIEGGVLIIIANFFCLIGNIVVTLDLFTIAEKTRQYNYQKIYQQIQSL